MTLTSNVVNHPVLVVCLCAQWCGVCRDYLSRFEQVQARFPKLTFLWIDVEDESDLLHPLDIDNFPTVLIGVGDDVRFMGPVVPHVETLDRLIRANLENDVATPTPNKDHVTLLARIRQVHGLLVRP